MHFVSKMQRNFKQSHKTEYHRPCGPESVKKQRSRISRIDKKDKIWSVFFQGLFTSHQIIEFNGYVRISLKILQNN